MALQDDIFDHTGLRDSWIYAPTANTTTINNNNNQKEKLGTGCVDEMEHMSGIAQSDETQALYFPSSSGWAVAVAVMSMMFSFVGYMAYIRMRGIFMGQMPELYLVSIVVES